MHVADRRGSELRDGCRRLGAAVGSVLARASLLVKPWGDPEPRNRWLYVEAWLLGACMLIGVVALIASCSSPSPPAQVLKHCVSGSGLSSFYIWLDLSQEEGQIRYQYFEQDALYRVTRLTVDDHLIKGTAIWEASATGETRGNPIEFAYDFEQDVLRDGSVTADCQNLQDRRLLEIPTR